MANRSIDPRFKYKRKDKKNRQSLTADEEKARAAALLQPVKNIEPFETRFTKHKTETDELNGVLGPFDVTRSTNDPKTGFRDTYVRRIWRRSKTKRHRAPTAFGMNSGWLKMRTDTIGTPIGTDVGSCYEMTIATQNNPNDAQASNKALSRFISQVRDSQSASAGVTLAEWHQSHNMIVARAGQLLQLAKAIRRRDLRAAEAIVLNVPKGFRPKAKTSANLWLEYHFGWSPLVQDIDSAVKVLSAIPPAMGIRSHGRWLDEVRQSGSGVQSYTRVGTYECRTLIGAEIYVSNPNLALANQLGLINPATVAWELIPFSFLVDWFLPVGQFLSSFSDLLGYSVHYPFTSTKRVMKTVFTQSDTSAGSLRKTTYDISCASVNRALSLPAFKLRSTPFKGFSAARGATAIALLVQQFLSMKAEPLVYSRHLR